MQKKRIFLWDNLKFLLIILVVVGHFIEADVNSEKFDAIHLFIYSFHMPLFFFISGLFHKNKDISKKVFNYISLGFLFKICLFVVEFYILDNKKSLSLFKEANLPWFLFALAFFILITYLLKDIEHKKILLISILLGLFVHYDKNISSFLVIGRTLTFFPFYYLGTIINKEKLLYFLKRKEIRIISFILIIGWLGLCLFKFDSLYNLTLVVRGNKPFAENIYNYGLIYQSILYISATTLGLSFISVMPNKEIPVITLLGQRTLQIYFWHLFVIIILTNIFNLDKILCTSPVGKIYYLIIAVITVFILSLKIFSFPTSFFVNKK